MYMQGKGTFKALGGSLTYVHAIEPGTVVILDGVVLAKIKAEPAWAKSLIDNHAKLVNPRGFETGNNMYNSPDPATIAARTQKILEKANGIVNAEKIPFEQAVNRVLDEHVAEALKASGVESQLKGQLEDIDPGSSVDVTSSAKIADRLNDQVGITPEKIGHALAGYKDEDAALLREMLAHQAEIFSSRRQAQELKAQSAMVDQAAAKRGVTDPGNVYYFIYKENKSYGMLAMAHREMTQASPDHYVNGPGELKTLALPDTKVLVILDDVAGSGQSLSSAYTQAREAGFKGEIIISPMVSTHQAPDTVQHGFGTKNANPDSYGAPADAKTQFVQKSWANALEDSDWFKTLRADKKERLRHLVEGMGYGQNALSMAFPYMSPDNNNFMFAGTVADQFIVNQNGDAVKNKGKYTGMNK
jgi:hypoxanthine phosphoribosyltransferase